MLALESMSLWGDELGGGISCASVKRDLGDVEGKKTGRKELRDRFNLPGLSSLPCRTHIGHHTPRIGDGIHV